MLFDISTRRESFDEPEAELEDEREDELDDVELEVSEVLLLSESLLELERLLHNESKTAEDDIDG